MFTSRCLDLGIIPVSVRLKSEGSKLSKKAKEMIYRAEKQLLQDRGRCINASLDDNRKAINKCKAELVSKVTNTTDRNKCTKFIRKVSEEQFKKVKERQVRKLNSLVNKTINKNSNSITHRATGNHNNSRSCPNNTMQGVISNSQVGNPSDNNNNNNNNNNNKWVINLSRTSLTKMQESLLAKHPNFALAPSSIPSTEYITVVESIYSKLKEQEAQELRAEVNSLLRRAYTPKPNLTKQERKGLSQLRKDKNRLIFTTDKGVTMVVMDEEDYINKAKELLGQQAYKRLDKYPTNRIKAKLITKLKTIKKETKLDEGAYKIMYPTSCVPPSFMDYLQVTLLTRPKKITLQLGECLTSYDVTALFTSVPIEPALKIIRSLLEKDEKLQDRTVLSEQHITDLLDFCLNNTYFSFQN